MTHPLVDSSYFIGSNSGDFQEEEEEEEEEDKLEERKRGEVVARPSPFSTTLDIEAFKLGIERNRTSNDRPLPPATDIKNRCTKESPSNRSLRTGNDNSPLLPERVENEPGESYVENSLVVAASSSLVGIHATTTTLVHLSQSGSSPTAYDHDDGDSNALDIEAFKSDGIERVVAKPLGRQLQQTARQRQSPSNEQQQQQEQHQQQQRVTTSSRTSSRPGAFPIAGLEPRSSDSSGDSSGSDDDNNSEAAASDLVLDDVESNIDPCSGESSSRRCGVDPLSAILVMEESESDDDGPTLVEFKEMSTTLQGTSLPQSVSEQRRDDKKIKKKIRICDTKSTQFNYACLVLFFLVLLAMVLGLTLRNATTTSSSNAQETRNDDQEDAVVDDDQNFQNSHPDNHGAFVVVELVEYYYYRPYREGLLGPTISALKDPSSPQYKANAWMMEDPFLPNYPLWRQKQRFSLVVKYFGTQGEYWFRNDNWLSYEVSECDWWFRQPPCNDKGEMEIENLSANNLSGTFPFESAIASMMYLDNSHNHIGGNIPPLEDMGKLEVFIMSHNNLEGPIVVFGGFNAYNLRVIKVDGNALEGVYLGMILPLVPKLQIVNFTNNKFGGSLPNTLATSTNLSYLGMKGNQYVGTIPTEFGLLSSLQGLDLSNNPSLTGTVPPQLGLLDRLTYLDVSGTSLSGSIPNELCGSSTGGGGAIGDDGGSSTTGGEGSGREEEFLSVVANCSRLQCCPPPL